MHISHDIPFLLHQDRRLHHHSVTMAALKTSLFASSTKQRYKDYIRINCTQQQTLISLPKSQSLTQIYENLYYNAPMPSTILD